MPRALLSVSDKTGITEFARFLASEGYEIISTGGTKKELDAANIQATDVEKITGYPECFGGRVKTMHPAVTGGVLMRRNSTSDQMEAKHLGIEPIDMVVINLYPFGQTLRREGASGGEIIEQIDIGGPTLLRSASKNYHDVIAICDPKDYSSVMKMMQEHTLNEAARRALAAKVFLHTAEYDSLIAGYLSGGKHLGVVVTNGETLRYGENPHQTGLFYTSIEDQNPYVMHQGKPLSYLNILDGDAAWNMSSEFSEPTAVMVKHANPSGVASDENIDVAFQKAYDTDRLSAFGVIVSINRICTAEIANKIIDQKIFTELILAPGYEPEAVKILKHKPNIRVLEVPEKNNEALRKTYRSAFGGLLVQDEDNRIVIADELRVVTEKKPTDEQLRDLLFAWKVVKHAKSNAIVLAKKNETVGIGCGQTSRVDSTWIAVKRAGDRAKNSVLASDAFFPFPDAVEEAAKNGIAAVIQPGGSIRDEEVLKRANELGIAMLFTGVRAFRH